MHSPHSHHGDGKALLLLSKAKYLHPTSQHIIPSFRERGRERDIYPLTPLLQALPIPLLLVTARIFTGRVARGRELYFLSSYALRLTPLGLISQYHPGPPCCLPWNFLESLWPISSVPHVLLPETMTRLGFHGISHVSGHLSGSSPMPSLKWGGKFLPFPRFSVSSLSSVTCPCPTADPTLHSLMTLNPYLQP